MKGILAALIVVVAAVVVAVIDEDPQHGQVTCFEKGEQVYQSEVVKEPCFSIKTSSTTKVIYNVYKDCDVRGKRNLSAVALTSDSSCEISWREPSTE